NEAAVRDIIRATIKKLAEKDGCDRTCACSNALAGAITTSTDIIPQESREKLDLLIGKYI
ncbi:MAG: S-methyl-5'-thioadenosine phosphorylase, partial [Methanosarcinales archaeon]|nr:S-methyl-5'-thioadenosine phosphorylase [Methanosarcinales archaeon]